MFEKPDKKALAIIKLEILAILLLFTAFLRIIAPLEAIIAADALLSALYLFFLFTETRGLFARDFRAYALFFAFLFLLIQANFLSQLLPVAAMELRLQIFFGLAIAFIAFLLVFRVFFVRNFVHGKVLSCEKGKALVQTEFDFLAMVNAGKHEVKSHRRLEKGRAVKVKIKQGFFGRKPGEIME